MVSFLVSIMVVSYAMGPIALISMRKFDAKPHQGFRLPFAQGFALIGFLIAYVRMDAAAKAKLGVRSLMWLVPYFLGLILISYLGAFGGLQVFTFGWDFFIIAIFSIVIFYLAIGCAVNQSVK